VLLKNADDGAREGAQFIADHIIRVTGKAFDDFAGSAPDQAQIERMLGITLRGRAWPSRGEFGLA